MLFRRFLPAPALLLLLSFFASAAPLKPTYLLRDHGRKREFIVALDELHRQERVQPVALRASAEAIRTAATAAGGDLVLYEKGMPRADWSRRFVTKELAVQLAPGANAGATAVAAGVANRGAAPGAPGWLLFRAQRGAGSALEAAERLRALPGVVAADPLLARQQSKRSLPSGPYYANQWNFLNSGASGGAVGADLDLVPAWSSFQGETVTIGIVDDGMESTHPDLKDNFDAAHSYDFDYDDTDPLPPPYDGDDHGTACAGLAAASGLNGAGTYGVAYQARLAGLRLISTPTTDAQEAAAFAFDNDAIQIKSNSWGPADTGTLEEGPGPLASAALADGVLNGRGGLGTIYVWAGGNGGLVGDSSSFDGYASRREVIGVGALGNTGIKAPYSEKGASLLCVAPSSGGTLEISTVDRQGDDGYNYTGAPDYPDRDYTRTFGGTSAAAPQIAGVAALMLQANAGLGWRDVKEILLRTAAKPQPSDPGWVTNGASFSFNDKYGAGLVDASAAVNLAQTWTNLPPEISMAQEQANLAAVIPDNRASGISRTFVFSQTQLRVEQVTVAVDIKHAIRGQVEVTLTSPMGTVVTMAPTRPRDNHADFEDAVFTTPHFWGETGDGTWKVTVSDRVAGTVGVLQRVRLELFGSAIGGRATAAGYTVTADANSNGAVDPGEAVTVSFNVLNDGTQTLAGATATLAASASIATPSAAVSLGNLAPGASAPASFSFTAVGSLGATIYATVQIASSNGPAGEAIFPIVLGTVKTQIFTSSESISIPGYPRTLGKAAPYGKTTGPTATGAGSVIEIPALGNAAITKVVLHLSHLWHDRSADIDMLLVSPQGGKMIPMSDVGGYLADDINLVLEDDAASAMPDTAELFGGTYRPSNYGAAIDLFPAPAPSRPYGANFAVFNGQNPSGLWELFIYDDATGSVGGLGEWSLEISYAQ